MASKRTIKKQLTGMISEIVDECYSEQLYNGGKKEASDHLIDEAIDFLDQTLSKINAARTKKDFPEIYREMDEKEDYFIEKLSKL